MSSRMRDVIVFLVEIIAGIIVGAVVAAILLPLAYSERGYFAIGAEWYLIIMSAYVGFTAMNKYIFDGAERSY